MEESLNTIRRSGLESQLCNEFCNYMTTNQFVVLDVNTPIPEEKIKRYSPEPQKPNRNLPNINENATHKPKPPTADHRNLQSEDPGSSTIKRSTSKGETELEVNNGIFYEKKVIMDSGLPRISQEDRNIGYIGQPTSKLAHKKTESHQDTVITEEMSKGKFTDFEQTQSSVF